MHLSVYCPTTYRQAYMTDLTESNVNGVIFPSRLPHPFWANIWIKHIIVFDAFDLYCSYIAIEISSFIYLLLLYNTTHTLKIIKKTEYYDIKGVLRVRWQQVPTAQTNYLLIHNYKLITCLSMGTKLY